MGSLGWLRKGKGEKEINTKYCIPQIPWAQGRREKMKDNEILEIKGNSALKRNYVNKNR